jgi:hypothetical protein
MATTHQKYGVLRSAFDFRVACALSALLLPLAASAQHPLDNLPTGEWFEVPNSAVRSVIYQYPAGTYFGNTDNMRFLTESGGSYDTVRDRLVVWGGGHGDYAGNEFYAFNIASMSWSRINDPAPRFDASGALELTGYYPDANGNPDPQQPRSRHSYWYQLYVPQIDRYCSYGDVFSFPNAKTARNVDCFDFNTERWERKKDAITTGGMGIAVYDPATRHVWIHGTHWSNTEGFLAEWDPASDVATKRSNAPSGAKQGSAPALDTRRHQLALLGVGELRVFDLNQGGLIAPQLKNVQGATAILQMSRGGFAYDPINDRYVAWSGDIGGQPRDIYVITPDTWVATRVTLGGATAPSAPMNFSNGGSNGVYGRFAYIPTKQAFILINNRLDDKVFFFKLPPSGAGSPDTKVPTAPAALNAS